MTTPRIRSRVSLAAALALAVAIGGCASAPVRPGRDEPAPADRPWLTVQFDNEARDYVHVYLAGERRQWLLGRVEAGAGARLRIPEAVLAEDPGPLRLVVLTGGRLTLRAADDPRATVTMVQSAGAIVSHRWTFSRTPMAGQLTPRR